MPNRWITRYRDERGALTRRSLLSQGRQETHLRILAACFARVMPIRLPPKIKRAQGMPGRTLPPRSRTQKVDSDAHEHTGSAETLRHSLRDGLTAYAKLAPATNSVLVTVAGGLTAGSYRLVRLRLRRLDISHGCQAHMVLPYATRLLRPRAQSGMTSVVRTLCPLTGKPALRPPHAPNAAASTATCSNDRDDGRRPSWRNRMGAFYG